MRGRGCGARRHETARCGAMRGEAGRTLHGVRPHEVYDSGVLVEDGRVQLQAVVAHSVADDGRGE